MHLVTTGQFVRQARQARLTITKYSSPISVSTQRLPLPFASASKPWSIRTRACGPSQRENRHYATAQAASQADCAIESWDQHRAIKTQHNERKLARQSKLAAEEVDEDFVKQLDSQIPNEVIKIDGKSGINIPPRVHVLDAISNLSPGICTLLDRQLYTQPDHPLCITRKLVESVFGAPEYSNITDRDPVVSTIDNFDVLGFPQDHPGRSRTDTYYVNTKNVLRTHTSAHQLDAFKAMQENSTAGYTICADVFRRDSIDRSHMPVFHQMEGARLWELPIGSNPSTREAQIEADLRKLPKNNVEVSDPNPPYHSERNPTQPEHAPREVELSGAHLKRSLETLVATLFARANPHSTQPLQVRWVEAYFPFTSPSWELEVLHNGAYLELLGCGIVRHQILLNAGLPTRMGWAWGIGLERLAMILFKIPDIRLFWSTDRRFLSQFSEGQISIFEPFSKYPACYKDLSFWLPRTEAPPSVNASPVASSTGGSAAAAAGGDATKASPAEVVPNAFHENDLMEVVRDVAGNLAEDVQLVDEFVHPKSGRKSLAYRINYRSLERTLTNSEVNEVNGKVVDELVRKLGVEMR